MSLVHSDHPLHNCGSVAIHRAVIATVTRNTATPSIGRHKGTWPGRRGEADIAFTCPRHRGEEVR